MIKIRKDTTEHQLSAQKYCIDKNIDIDNTNDDSGWAVWITFPNGVDKVYSCYLSTEEEMSEQYWKAITYAADFWWQHERNEMTVPVVPQVPPIPSVPQVSKVPAVPQVPKVPPVPQVPRIPQVPQVPK